MRIINVCEDYIEFDNGNKITYFHYQDCCEINYADFAQIEDLALKYNFNKNLQFEVVDGYGFRFGDSVFKTFIPCYSEQNGYYSFDVDIYYNGKLVLKGVECQNKY